ncbi:MAG TPA: ABC transporter permease [Acidimicrobiales bacterium]|nr:ABC transporter permease [Acidimicrobiales bacterium]
MIGFIFRRFLQAIVVVLGVMLIVFLLAHIIPGGAARAALGPRATKIQIRQFNHLNNYDAPLIKQFWLYIKGLVTSFNLGYSYHWNQGVTQVIMARLPKTLVLVGLGTLVAVVVAVPLGILQVVRRNKPIDYVLTTLSFVFYAMPVFLLGALLILYFSFDLHWFSSEAPQGSSVGAILSDPGGLVLPVFTLAALTIASFSRYMRSSMMETLTEDYVRTARAKGAGPRRVLYVHALRNAVIPIITLLGLSIPAIVGGALVTEALFNYPGMGLLAYQAITNTDIPLLLGTTFFATLATIVGSLLADILYAAVDPRIRYAN